MASPARRARRELRGHRPTDRPHPPQVTRLSRPSLFIPWREPRAERRAERHPRVGRQNQIITRRHQGKLGRPLTIPLESPRAREARRRPTCSGNCRTAAISFLCFSFCVFLFVFKKKKKKKISRCGAVRQEPEVGVAGAVRAPLATGSSINRSAESAAGDMAQPPSLLTPWRSRAPSAAPNDTRRRRRLGGLAEVALSLSLGAAALVPNATRGGRQNDHHAQTSGEIGGPLTILLWNLRAREKRAAGSLRRHLPHRPPFPFSVFFLFVFPFCLFRAAALVR